MRRSARLSRAERILAICLSLVWLLSGSVGLYVGVVHSRWVLVAFALLALLYGAAWLRAAALSRLLGWRELIAPWRSGS